MRVVLLGCLVLCAAGCGGKDPVLPAVPPMPDDLALWSAPVVPPLPPVIEVAPPAQEVLPVPAVKTSPLPKGKRGAACSSAPPRPAGLPLFVDDAEFAASVMPGYPLTVVLESGETIVSISGGDRPLLAEGEVAPWEIKHSPPGTRPYVFITVTKPGLAMGLVVATDRRTYTLSLKSVPQTTTRQLRWRYAAPPVVAVVPAVPSGPLPTGRFRLHIGYSVTAQGDTRPEWTPTVYDSGEKMFLIFPITTLYQEAPLLRGIGVNGPYLLNSRQVGRVVVVDQVAPRLELRLGTGERASVVQVTRGMLDTINCPGHVQCPNW